MSALTSVRPVLRPEDIRPLHDQVLIRKRLSAPVERGMLLVPESTRFRDHIADVLSVGGEVRDVRAGDVVVVADMADAGRKARFDGGDVVAVVAERDLLAVLEGM